MAGLASSSSSSSEDLSQQVDDRGSDQRYNELLQHRRSELMNELKRLQHGDRPVTGSASRQTVDNFLSRRLQRPSNSANVANIDAVEEHRPEQITIEVQGLLQRGSVSSVLNSDAFRRSLENIVRGHVNQSYINLPQATNTSASFDALRSNQGTQRLASSETPRSNQTAHRWASSETPRSNQTARRWASSETPRSNQTAHRLASPEPSRLNNSPNPHIESTPSLIPPPPPLPSDNVPSDNVPSDNTGHNITLEETRAINQEQLAMEISELVHRQLVSSTLQSDFRGRLERLTMRLLNESGADGRIAQETILRLPPSNIRRNDFSHLGLLPPGDNDLDDAISIISATASATIPYTQSNAAVNRELMSMKAQIKQLTAMMKMSLDLQMDVQRSIRQEVAAAINQANSGPSAPPTKINSKRAMDSKCIICVEGEADCVLYRCGHICMCFSCALRMRDSSGSCPVCRAPITDVVRAYRISHD